MVRNIWKMSNSLQNSLSAIDTIDQIRLFINSDLGKNMVYVLVEGINDCKIYPKFFDKNKTSVEYVNGGKGQVLIALNELKKITKQVISICDADFNHLQNVVPYTNNLFFTDYHDIEMTMLFIDGVLNDTLTEYKLQNNSSAILRKALEEAQIIGYIRWHNEIDVIKLDFKGMGLGHFVMPHDINAHLDVDIYINALNKRSKHKTKTITYAEINNFMLTHNTDDLFNLCNGQDVTALISLIIDSGISHENFCSILRASFNVNYFHKTKLYSNILKWQTDHGFLILLT
jgi:hypothetical protein